MDPCLAAFGLFAVALFDQVFADHDLAGLVPVLGADFALVPIHVPLVEIAQDDRPVIVVVRNALAAFLDESLEVIFFAPDVFGRGQQ